MGRGMITLGIETATQVVGVALAGDEGVIGMVEITNRRRHAEILVPAIEFLCKHAQIVPGDIAALGVDVGPGLFTGMRVGIATAKAMAMALHVPVVGMSSLDLLAHPVRHTSKVIASVIDARKGEVFFALYLPCPGGVQRVAGPRVGSVDDLNADVMARGQDVLAVGDGAWRYRDELERIVEVADLAHPSAATLVQLARARTLRDDLTEKSADLVEPLYLRAPDAQINWSTR
jgi:tRNA threonylcarbamoyladenosine biosynthesis protein TsaB